MKNFLMICYVAADFMGPDGALFRITPDKIGVFVEAPEWIKNTLLFRMLVSDGSIKVGESSNQKKLENDPMEGIGADGKKIEDDVEVVDAPVTIKTRKTPAKKKG